MASVSDPIRPTRHSPVLISLILLAARGLAAIAAALTTFLLARFMPSAEVGGIMALVSAAMLASLVLSLNIETGAMRFLVTARAEGQTARMHGFIRFSRQVIRVLALPVMAGTALVVILAGLETSAVPLILATLLIPPLAWSRATARQAGALHEVLRGGLPQLVLRPVVVLAGIGAALIAGLKPDASAVLTLFLAGAVLTVAVQSVLLRPVLAPILATAPDDTDAPRWALTGLKLAPSLLFQDLLRDLILVLAAFGLAAGDTGILAVCLAVVLLPNLALIGIEMGFGPQVSAAFATGNRAALTGLLRQASLLRLASVLPVVLIVELFPGPILAFFGPDYAAATDALRLLGLLPLTRAFFGNPFLLLNVNGNSDILFRATGIGLGLMLLTVPVAAALSGLAGAALAAVFGFVWVQARLYASCLRSCEADPSVLSLVPRRAP